MTELETAIREALHERADAAPIRHTALVSRRRLRWFAPVLAAALVIALVAISLVLVSRHDATTPPAAQKSSSFVGYTWRLVQIDDRQGRLTLPPSTKAEVSFGQRGTMSGNDTVHELGVRYRVVATGYQPTGPVTGSGNGLAGPISTNLKRTLFAIGSCFASAQLDGNKPPLSAPVSATVHGNRLTLHTSDGVLTFVRTGVVREHPRPSR